jgi:hypothetical protein
MKSCLPGQEVVVSVPHRLGPEASQVGAGLGLGRPYGHELLTGNDPGQPLPLQLLGPEAPHCVARVQRHHDRQHAVEVPSGDLFHHHADGDPIGFEAAVLSRDVQAQESQFHHLLDLLCGKCRLPVSPGVQRSQLLPGEPLEVAAQELLFLGEREIDHDRLPGT